MTSPVDTSVGQRRRQRSTRIVVAALLIVLAAGLVVGTAMTGSFGVVLGAAALAVALGAAATRITYTELLDSRRAAATDRAAQARAYADLTVARTAENVEFAADLQGRLARRDATISRLEKRLGETAAQLADARREAAAAQERSAEAQRSMERLTARLSDAEERAEQAVIRVAELEAEVDVLHAEWQALEAASAEGSRRRAV